jgi:nucleotide-binding universal stress UspA family protein
MTHQEIHHITCAVRGVPKSRDTVTKAIDLALEHNARLNFVHVINLDLGFVGPASPSMAPIRAVQKQMHKLSTFTMVVLCDRAQRRGVKEVDYIVRDGQVIEQLQLILNETRPDLLVIGQPITNLADSSMLLPDELSDFIVEVEQNLKIQVVPVEIELID